MADPKASRRAPRSVRAYRRRAQYFADQERRAVDSPAGLFKVAMDRLQSAARNTKCGEQEIRKLASDITEQARLTADRADTPAASRRHNEDAIASAATGCAQLASALRWLKTSLAQMPHDTRDRAYAGYTQQLDSEAQRLLRNERT